MPIAHGRAILETSTAIRTAQSRISWLRRLWGGSTGSAVVLVLLAIWVLEPLSCVTYCRNWTLLQLHSAFAAQHQAQHVPTNATTLDAVTSELAHLRPVIFSNLFVCFIDPMHGAPPGS